MPTKSRTPSRKILSVVRLADRIDVTVEHAVHGFGTIVPPDALTRQELVAACKVAFPGVKGNRWLSCPNTVLLGALRSGEVPEDLAEVIPQAGGGGPATDKQVAFLERNGWSNSDAAALTKAEASKAVGDIIAATKAAKAEVAPAPVPTVGTDEATQLAELLRRIAGPGKVEIDPEAIREAAVTAAKAAVEEGLANLRPHITEVRLGEREPIVIEGRQHAVFPKLLRYMGRRHHVFLVGPAGTGKTTLASQAAKALGLHYGAISCNPGMQPSALFGFVDATGTYRATEFRRCYEEGGVFLFDEIDNAHPSTLAGVNQSLANGECAFPDGMVKRNADFIAVAAGNTFGLGADRQYVGRLQLDAATLDRFWKVEVGVDEELEEYVVRSHITNRVEADTWIAKVRRYRANAEKHKLHVVVSPRAAIEGAQAIADGEAVAEVVADRIENGLTADTLAKLRA